MIRRFHLVPESLHDELKKLGMDPKRFSIPLPRLPFVGSLSEIQGLQNQDPKAPQKVMRRLDRGRMDDRMEQQSSSTGGGGGGGHGGGGGVFQDPIQKLKMSHRLE